MIKKCHKQDEFVARIEGALNVRMGRVTCKIVDGDGMAEVMSKAGWSKNQARGVVGFQVDEEVYVLESAPWTVLHELVHRAGINADRMSRWVAEGLTEAIACELKRSSDEHKATYPQEVKWVRETLLPRLGMSAVELGRRLANAPNPARVLAELMAAAKPGTDVSALEYQLRPQAGGKPSFNRTYVTRLGGSGVDRAPSEGIGWLLMVAGMLLVGPSFLRRL